MTSIGRKVVSSAAWAAVETWGRQVAMFAVFIVLARHLGPEAFGLATLAMVAPLILAGVVTRGIPDAIVQRPEIEPIHLDSAFWLLVATGATLSALIWMLAGVIAELFDEPLLEGLVHWTCIIVAVQSLAAVPSAILKRELNFRLFALRTLTGTIVGGTLGLALAIAGYGMWSLVWMQVAKAIVETTVILVGSSWRPRMVYSYARCRELFGFAGPIVVQTLWTFVNEEIPKVVLGLFFGPAAVGIYAIARRPLDLLAEFLLGPLTAIAMPAVSRVQREPEKIDHFFNTSVRMAGIAGFPAFIGFAAIAPIAVPLVFGSQWASAVVAVQILMILGLQRTIDSLCAFTILALGHSALVLKLNVAYTFLSIALLTAAAQISLEAVIAALVACNLLLLPVFLFYVQRIAQIDVSRPLAIFPRLAGAAAIMFAIVSAWMLSAPENVPQALTVAGGIAIGAPVYIAAALVLVRADLLNARDMLLSLRE
ncbi:MAG TPA: lipopolysaccharide biosynthesis protein [Sinorhizobium sp.]|nr:lipopolysaccharide biosynthesis protein [Sinorhizobium sp.]